MISLVCTGLMLNTILASVCSCCTPQIMSCVMINFDGRTDSPVSLCLVLQNVVMILYISMKRETSRRSSGHYNIMQYTILKENL